MQDVTSVDGNGSTVRTYSYNEKGNLLEENQIQKVSDRTNIYETIYSYEYYEDGKIKTRTAVQTSEVIEEPKKDVEDSENNWWTD